MREGGGVCKRFQCFKKWGGPKTLYPVLKGVGGGRKTFWICDFHHNYVAPLPVINDRSITQGKKAHLSNMHVTSPPLVMEFRGPLKTRDRCALTF